VIVIRIIGGRCDARCYNGQTKTRCRCVCGGQNHGRGLIGALARQAETLHVDRRAPPFGTLRRPAFPAAPLPHERHPIEQLEFSPPDTAVLQMTGTE
jgi:hypothetical protein